MGRPDGGRSLRPPGAPGEHHDAAAAAAPPAGPASGDGARALPVCRKNDMDSDHDSTVTTGKEAARANQFPKPQLSKMVR
jgi:hypothetical protein